jgi:hypothetical protein
MYYTLMINVAGVAAMLLKIVVELRTVDGEKGARVIFSLPFSELKL